MIHFNPSDFLSDDLPRYYVRDHDRRRDLDRTRPVGHTTGCQER